MNDELVDPRPKTVAAAKQEVTRLVWEVAAMADLFIRVKDENKTSAYTVTQQEEDALRTAVRGYRQAFQWLAELSVRDAGVNP